MYVERKEGECFLIKGAKKIIWWYRKVCERERERKRKKEGRRIFMLINAMWRLVIIHLKSYERNLDVYLH